MAKNEVRLSKAQAYVIMMMQRVKIRPLIYKGKYYIGAVHVQLKTIKCLERKGVIVWGASEYVLTDLGRTIPID